MPLRSVALAACLYATSASHYEKPPCQADELAGNIASGAELCAPKCDASGTCPTDVPNGTKASPQCALKTTSGDKYCALVCKAEGECPTGSQCTKPAPSLPTGVCTYAAGLKSASVTATGVPGQLFEEFAATVGRIYVSATERERRFEVFAKNLEHILKLQALDTDATYDHTSPFADWTMDEFLALNTLKPQLLDADSMEHDVPHNTSSLPDAFDWVEKGAVNEVKNQGSCGSCWAFSTNANIEGVNFVKTQKLVSLSEQQLVDCDTTSDHGCQGGLPANAYQFLISQSMGLESETNYPYTGRNGKCSAAKADELVFVSGWKQIASDEGQMAAALVQYGPLSIGINAGPMQWYRGGIANPWKILCNPKSIDHGVAIVGFGSEPKSYWKIRNSWGASWGEEGYYRIVRGVNKCGLTSMPTTAVIGSTSLVV